MKPIVCLLLLCAASAALAARPASHAPATANDESPWFCHDLDCPKFTVVKNITDDVQLRRYAAGERPGFLVQLYCSWTAAHARTCMQHMRALV